MTSLYEQAIKLSKGRLYPATTHMPFPWGPFDDRKRQVYYRGVYRRLYRLRNPIADNQPHLRSYLTLLRKRFTEDYNIRKQKYIPVVDLGQARNDDKDLEHTWRTLEFVNKACGFNREETPRGKQMFSLTEGAGYNSFERKIIHNILFTEWSKWNSVEKTAKRDSSRKNNEDMWSVTHLPDGIETSKPNKQEAQLLKKYFQILPIMVYEKNLILLNESLGLRL